MTTLIEPYSGYVLAWLLVGLVFNTLIIMGICKDRYPRTIKPTFSGYMVMWLFSPALLAYFIIVGLYQISWDALKAFKRFGRSKSGTEELFIGSVYLWFAWLISTSDLQGSTKTVGIALFSITSLYLFQAAKAIQLLNKK